MGLILSDKQEVEIAKRVIVFDVCSTVDSCGRGGSFGGSFEVHELSLSSCQ